MYVFGGYGPARGERVVGPRLVDMARLAGVSAGTVSNVVNRPEVVAEPMRAWVAAAMTGLGWVPGAPSGELAPHWRRNNFGGRVFQPAVTGRYPGKVPRPVPISGEPWPGRLVGGSQRGWSG